MSGAAERLLRLLKEARQKLESERKRRTEPIAIVGVGCRFPGGASNPSAFWDLLTSGTDATGEIPTDRWDAEAIYDPDPTAPGKSYVKRGGFLDRIDGFEPEFFGISPREAGGLDPQQRLLLEVVWEALENGGIAAHSLRGSATGVWIGLSLDDYAGRSLTSGQLDRIDPYSALGNARSVAAGRIAYVLDLHGPVMQVDTSCSSSLVAVHLACQSLRAGECDIALVGGVNVMSSPEATVALCKLQALARDGRCKTFDASADGYGRGEGCGIVVLKRLADAEAAGDRILALIRGSAVNHDGRSNGLTAPNGVAQEAVIRSALANAGLDAASVDYVEAHGTGTLLGDPIEVLALSRVYGAGHSEQEPLYIGSVKTNFGHLEGAAGIAGVIKTALCLSHRRIVPHLNFRDPNPKIPWSDLAVRVAAQAIDWPRQDKPGTAGVSSFGISGTNAHVLLEEAPLSNAVTQLPPLPPVEAPSAQPSRSAELVVLSARTESALKGAAADLRAHLEEHRELTLAEIAYSLMAGRSSLERRWAFAAPTRKALVEALEGARDALTVAGARAPIQGARPKVAFVLSGQGSQWLGMGRQLFTEEPAFRQALVTCDRAIRLETGWSVIDELETNADASHVDRVGVVQPVLFALQISLALLWRSWGIQPDAVIGHSMGEIAAACVSGALALRDAAAVVCLRSRLLGRISGQGEMALVELSIEQAQQRLTGYEDRVSVAVSNGPRSTVLSGDAAALAKLLRKLDEEGIFSRRVKVDVASHSPQVDSLLHELVAGLHRLSPRSAEVPIYSTVTGEVLSGGELGAQYWADNLRRPVAFSRTVQKLMADGFTSFVELSPHPLLVSAVEEIRLSSGTEGVVVGSLRRDYPERLAMLESLGSLYAHGHPLEASRLFPAGGRRVELPTYPWQRRSYWIEAPRASREGVETGHPLLGIRVNAAGVDAMYESMVAANHPHWLGDHRVGGKVVVPATGLLELARAAAEYCREDSMVRIKELVLERPLLLASGKRERVQVVVTEDASRIAIYARPEHAGQAAPWTLHATAELASATAGSVERLDVPALRRRCSEAADVAKAYESLAALGLQYGPSFRGIERLWRGNGEALAEVVLRDTADAEHYALHPALLDAAMQTVLAALGRVPERPMLPFELGDFEILRAASSAIVHARIEEAGADDFVATVTLVDASGQPLARIGRLRLRAVDLAEMEPDREPVADLLYRLDWRPVPSAPSGALSGRWMVIPVGRTESAEALRERLSALGASAELVPLEKVTQAELADNVVCFWDADGDDAADGAMRAAVQGLAIVRSIAKGTRVPRLFWMTRNAVAVAGEPVRPALSALWGLGRTVAQEHPDLCCTLIDVDGEERGARALACEAAAQDEIQMAWRGEQRYVARLVHAPRDRSGNSPPRFRGDGTFLITGGLGGLGLELARHLAACGARRLLLLGRRGLEAEGARQAVAELAALGTRVTVAAVDVSDRERLARVIADIPAEYPLRGVIHAAAVLDDGVLSEQTPERFTKVMAPKALGAWNLHQLTERLALDHFVLFSSLAGTLGSAGQGAYAAANTFLDGVAAHRRARGLVGLSVAWGPWAARGLATKLESNLRARLVRQGIGMLSPAQGVSLFDAALARSDSQLVAAALTPATATRDSGGAVQSPWRALVRKAATGTPAPAAILSRDFSALPESERLAAVTELVRAAVARVLMLPSPSAAALDQPLKDAGLDSLMALELRNALARATGITLPATLVFHHPTPRAIAKHLVAKALEREAASDAATPKAMAYGERLNSLENPKARLFCFHDAGGSAAMFIPFCQLGSAGIEVHAISQTRSSSPTAASAERYLREVVAYIRGLSDRPYALFGHSLGGFFAWRVAEELAREAIHLPVFLGISASVLPFQVEGPVSKDDLAEAFHLVVGGRMQTNDAMQRDFAADTLLWRAMSAPESRPLGVPIAAFVGREDHIASENAMRAWARMTTGEFSLTVLPGGHFYPRDADPRQITLKGVLQRMTAAMSRDDSGE